jgi:HK97 family phage major capsid protein
MKRNRMNTSALALALAVSQHPGVRRHAAEVPAITAEDITQINGALKAVRDDLARKAEAFYREIKANGTVGTEAKAAADKLLAEQGALVARLQKAEQLIAELDKLPGRRESNVVVLPGARFTASDAFKALEARGGSRSIQPGNGTHAHAEFNAGFQAMRQMLRVNAATLTSSTSSAGDLLVPQYDGLVPGARRGFRIMDLIGIRRTSAQLIKYVTETLTNAAAPVSENPASAKPASTIVYADASAEVKTIAHTIKASKQILDDVPQLQDEVNAAMLYMLEYVLEEQILKGSGVGLNLNGIVTQATAYSNPGVNVQAESAVDRLRLAMLQVALANRVPDGIVLNPIDWTDMELTKDTTNRYLFARADGMMGPVLWGLPVVDTAAMTANSFLVGAFRNGATYYDREQMNVAIATQNEDDFVKNLLTIRAETRGALAVKMPEAFVTGNFDGVESE